MADKFTPEKRSRIMAAVKGKNTAPEIRVRSILHRLGYRFRLHRRDLPGNPDIVLPKYRTVIFVNGCFWHGHEGCSRAALPSTNREFWTAKIDRNVRRDRDKQSELQGLGWSVLTIWQCEMRDLPDLESRLARIGRRPEPS